MRLKSTKAKNQIIINLSKKIKNPMALTIIIILSIFIVLTLTLSLNANNAQASNIMVSDGNDVEVYNENYAITDISSGHSHSIALSGNGEILTWGSNTYGQLGDGTYDESLVPIKVYVPDVKFKSVSAGKYYSMALSESGEIYTWGYNDKGQLGDNTLVSKNVPTKITVSGVTFEAIYGGADDHSMALSTTKEIFAWGCNDYGQIGDNSTNDLRIPTKITVNGVVFNDIKCGKEYSMALSTTGIIYTWGHNNYGQLGDNTTTNKLIPTKITVSGVEFDDISAGFGHSMALSTTGELYTWGYNNKGQLGDNTNVMKNVPTNITVSGKTFKSISAGYLYSTAISDSKEYYAWGDNSYGVFGNGTITSLWAPSKISIVDIKLNNIFAGDNFTLAIDESKNLYTWGSNSNAQLGDGTKEDNHNMIKIRTVKRETFKNISSSDSNTLALNSVGEIYFWGDDSVDPTKIIVDGVRFKEIANGVDSYLALSIDGNIYSWGNNSCGQLGDNTTINITDPTLIAASITFSDINTSNGTSIALGTDGNVYTWGYNLYGQIGDGNHSDTTLVKVPKQITTSGDFKAISNGTYYSMALNNNGELFTWGWNEYGQLGTNSTKDHYSPTNISAPRDLYFKEIDCSGGTSIGISVSGCIYTWGHNNEGQLGTGDKNDEFEPEKITNDLINFDKISTSGSHCLALTDSNELYSWGENSYVNLGDFTTNESLLPKNIEINDVGIDIEASLHSSFLINANREIYAWGHNDDGQLGDGTQNDRYSPMKIMVNSDTFKDTDVGKLFTLALTEMGDIYAWGNNAFGQLGDFTTINKDIPNKVNLNGITFSQISAGGFHSMALSSTGDIYTWGNNEFGELGNNSTVDLSSPTKISVSGVKFKAVSAGNYHSMALSTTGELYTWGYNSYGQLGNNSKTRLNIPTNITVDGVCFQKISAGDNHSVALSTTGDVYTWGYGLDGRLGNGSSTNTLIPTIIDINGGEIIEISAGGSNTAAINSNGQLYTCGDNLNGQIGDNTIEDKLTFTLISGSLYEDVEYGNNICMAINPDGKIYTWGNNNYGQLGNGTYIDKHIPTKMISKGEKFNTFSTSLYSTSAISISGKLYVSGRNLDGLLGDGGDLTTTNTPKLVKIKSVFTKDFSAGNNYAVEINESGEIYSWGYNNCGQLGDGTTETKYTRTKINVVGTYFQKVSAGHDHTIALSESGDIYAWGENEYGQLGDNTTIDKLEPVKITVIGVKFKDINAGQIHNIALSTTGDIYTWGRNFYGRIGDGTTNDKHVPTKITVSGVSFKSISAGSFHSMAISTSGENIIELLKQINNTGRTIIMVTHDNELAKLADRIITISDGKIIGDTNECN